MARKVQSYRLNEESIEWVASYSKQRDVPQAEILEAAIASFRSDCERGVPDLPEKVEATKPQVAPVPSLLGQRQARLAKEMGWSA